MRAVRVDRWAAFGVNRVGPRGAPFPLSASAVETEGAWRVHATAARAVDLVDVLATAAQDMAVVFNVGQTSWLSNDHTPWSLGQIARQQGIGEDTATVHDIRWAASARALSDDLLVIPWVDLPRLLHGWSPYQIEIIDTIGWPSGTEVDELVLTVNTEDDSGGLLSRLPGTRVHYSGHDDCYLQVETVDPGLPARLLCRLLALYAGSALLDGDTDAVTVPEPPRELAEVLLRQGSHWVGTVAASHPGRTVTLGLARMAGRWRLGDHPPARISHEISLHLKTARWDISTAPV